MSGSERTEAPAAIDWLGVWNAAPFACLIFDADNRVAEINAAAEDWLGLSVRAAAGRPVEALFGTASRIADLLGQVRAGAQSLGERGMDLALVDRPPSAADVTVAPVAEADGPVLVIIQPQSLAEQMDRSLTHRGAARSVTGMAAMLAHEIKNPLAGISGAAQLLAMQLGDQDAELTDLIREEAERIAKLMEKVELFGDGRPPVLGPVNIHDVLDRARRSAEAGFARHARFVEEFDPSLPPTAGDADQLMQVFVNLLKNAGEATPSIGGMITIRTAYRPGIRMAAPGGGHESLPLTVTITDNGPGVPEAIRRDLFEPFVTTKSTGSGLGLALVSKIMADHGGVVECESDPGWTTFRLRLPVWREERRARQGRKGVGRAAAPRSRHEGETEA